MLIHRNTQSYQDLLACQGGGPRGAWPSHYPIIQLIQLFLFGWKMNNIRTVQNVQNFHQSTLMLLSFSSFFMSLLFPLLNFDFICCSLLTIAMKSRLMDSPTSDKIVSSLSNLTLTKLSASQWPLSLLHLTHGVLGSNSILHLLHQYIPTWLGSLRLRAPSHFSDASK